MHNMAGISEHDHEAWRYTPLAKMTKAHLASSLVQVTASNLLPAPTKILAELVLDGGACRQVVGGCKVAVEAADQVDHGARDGAARLPREQRMALHHRQGLSGKEALQGTSCSQP